MTKVQRWGWRYVKSGKVRGLEPLGRGVPEIASTLHAAEAFAKGYNSDMRKRPENGGADTLRVVPIFITVGE